MTATPNEIVTMLKRTNPLTVSAIALQALLTVIDDENYIITDGKFMWEYSTPTKKFHAYIEEDPNGSRKVEIFTINEQESTPINFFSELVETVI